MENKHMSSETLQKRIWDFLGDQKEGSLATCFDNKPRSSPVRYFPGDGTNTYILSAGGKKFEAIAKNPNVCLLVSTDYVDFYQIKGVQVFGKAVTSLQDSSLFQEVKEQCKTVSTSENDLSGLNVIKIIPEEIVYLNSLGDGDRTKQILKLGE